MAITDKLTKVGSPGTVTSLQSPGKAIGATSINIGSATNWPTTTAVYFAIRQVDSTGKQLAGTYTEWKGTLSGTTISNLQLQSGSDQVYPPGSTTQVYVSVIAARENAIVDWGLAQHNQDGTHGAITTTSITNAGSYTQPSGTFSVPAGVITPSNLQSGTGSNWDLQTYTPTFTNFTLGNGTASFSYKQIGKNVRVYFTVTLGSTSSMGSGMQFSLPVTGTSPLSSVIPFGQATYVKSAVARYVGVVEQVSSTKAAFFYFDTGAGSYPVISNIGATVPFTWAANDGFTGWVEYQAA